MSISEQRVNVTGAHGSSAALTLFPVIAAGLAAYAGFAKTWGSSDATDRFVGFATMVVAVASGAVAIRRESVGVRAISAVVVVIALMLGSTFFGLTYS